MLRPHSGCRPTSSRPPVMKGDGTGLHLVTGSMKGSDPGSFVVGLDSSFIP